MKKLFTFFASIILSINLFAQAPQKMSYQAVIRNASNNLVVSSPVKMKISILQGSATGAAVYSELHNPTTNSNGLATIEIGSGTSPVGLIESINWSNGTYFLKTETDPTNGTAYSVVGTSQLLSVPYALHSNCVTSSLLGDTLIIGCTKYVIPGVTIPGISAHTCGKANVHNPALAYGSMTDQQGNRYRTIKIGNQTWMAEDLRTSIYRNGTRILDPTGNTEWGSNTTGAFSRYSYECPNGKLYNWYAVNNANQLCPLGWHVPTDEEWSTLATFLGGESIAGGKMKSTGSGEIGLWRTPNLAATNSSGWSGIPTGYRDPGGIFYQIGFAGYWWSTTQSSTANAWCRYLGFDFAGLGRYSYSKTYGYSVRCIRD
jgi:uncharacterized protein (TIGR02145 family)